MTLWLSKSSYTSEYIVWSTCPTPVYSKHFDNVLYTDGKVLARGLYSIDKLFPDLLIDKSGLCKIEIFNLCQDGATIHTIRRIPDESARTTEPE